MRTLARGAVLIVLVLFSLSSYAALSQKYDDWAKGPAKWLMTRDELRIWKTITTDEQAQAFIDLFWARRDPTPGTYLNEYKREFDYRVKYAEQNFGHQGTPGALTDRGHAVIVLGFPTVSDKSGKKDGAAARAASGSTGSFGSGSLLGEKEIWTWEKEDARKYDMPRIEAVFIQDPVNGVVQRDTQKNEIMTAFANAVEKAVVDRKMTVAPDWATQPPMVLAAEPAKKPSARGAAPAAPAAPHRQGAPGAHSLLLIKNAATLPDPQGGSDPLDGLKDVDLFATTDDLGYVFEYCGESETVKVTISISGQAGGRKISMSAPTEEVPVETIKVVPGCGIIRASIPLGDMKVLAGTYTFSVKLEDGPQSYNLSQDFKVE